MVRFCPTCNAEVEELGGFCLLGHPTDAPASAPTGTLKELRDEVERAFEDARLQVAAAMAPVTEPAETNGNGSHGVIQPPPPPRRTPPPPPPPQVFDSLRTEAGDSGDPISAFAPSPRMDWGPNDKTSRLRRRG
jgi:hypothetical protein